MNVRGTLQPFWVAPLIRVGRPRTKALDLIDAAAVGSAPVRLIYQARSDSEAPLSLLPYLAAERSVDEFSGDWPETQQRAVTRGSFAFHRVKGTRPALDRALNPLGIVMTLKEWFEHDVPRLPYTFSISIVLDAVTPYDASQRPLIVRTANRAKNAHTKLKSIEVLRPLPNAGVYVAGLPRRIRSLRVGQLPKVTTLRAPSYVFVGAALRRVRTMTVGPRQ